MLHHSEIKYINILQYCMDHEQWDVIVVGAGASGIGAATLLHKYEGSYVVLEGRKRVGGRVKSVEVDGVEVDLGACWVHSYSDKNPLRPEIKKLGWRQTVLDKATVGRRYIDGQSGKCFCKEVWQEGDQHYDQFYKTVSEIANKSEQDISVYEAGWPYMETFLEKACKPMKRYLQLLINMKQHYEASSAKDLSAKHYKYKTDYGRNFLPERSYAALLKRIAQPLNIRVGVHVKGIKYGKGVQVFCDDGSIVRGKKIIVTLPLGILKTHQVQFLPVLPPTHEEAIQKLGMGLMNKIIVSFSENFWGSCRWISIGCNERGRFSHLINLSRNGKHILCCFLTDDFANKVELMQDEQIIQQYIQLLQHIYGEKKVKVRDYHITRWGKEKYSLGSYSAFHVGSSPQHSFNLRKSVHDQLWIAGEHCYPEHIGTAHGAYQTGLWAAEQIVSLLKLPLKKLEQKNNPKMVHKKGKKNRGQKKQQKKEEKKIWK